MSESPQEEEVSKLLSESSPSSTKSDTSPSRRNRSGATEESMAPAYISRNNRFKSSMNFTQRRQAMQTSSRYCTPRFQMLAFITGTALYTTFLYRSG